MRSAWSAVVMGVVCVGLLATAAARAEGRLDRTDGTGSRTGARAASQDEGTQTLKVFSNEVVVDVEVIGADGKPVRGLTQADFTVKENGKEQALRSFAEYRDGVVLGQEMAKLPEGIYRNFQGEPVSGPVNILLLDALNASLGAVLIERRETLKYLQTMPEGTQVAIFWLSQGGLHLLQGVTQDRRLLIGAISRDLGGTRGLEEWTRQWLTVDALDEIAMYVSGIRGRKNLLWFTPGMPIQLVRDGGYGGGNGDMGLVHRLMDAYELLNRAQVAVSPVDPRGVGPGLGMGTLLMEEVAEESGGTAVYNTNGLAEAMGKAIEKESSYYTISYVPAGRKDDGRYHHIAVEVNRPGARLVYRKGYNAEDPLSPKAIAPGPGLTKAVMMGRAMTGTEIQFEVKMRAGGGVEEGEVFVPAKVRNGQGMPPPRGEKVGPAGVRYGFSYAVPAEQIAFKTGADGVRRAALEFDTAAYGKNGRLSKIVSQRVKIALTPEQYAEFMKAPFRVQQQMDIPPGQTMVRACILDDASKKVGTMEIPVKVDAGVAAR